MQNSFSISLGASIILDTDMEQIIKDNVPIQLSRIQFRILYYLAINIEKIVYSKDLIRFVWGSDYISLNSLYVYINYLRKYLEDGSPKPPLSNDYKITWIHTSFKKISVVKDESLSINFKKLRSASELLGKFSLVLPAICEISALKLEVLELREIQIC
ncbi:winged helix-turn-helix domain-containing protein [Desulfosporosinus sp. FKA]|uniref:winged helix-turn-helix domain-containing protein n=1 Tax=Desulfosporosinus sp. FKA TaxID=1969834 RepID=UPI000B49A3F4|nr:winged helix-turn-helix domain-containing protein [Desulfosporosinus sp. FKA]